MPSTPWREGAALVAGAEPAGDGGGGAVGEEDEEVDRRSASSAAATPRPASCAVPRWPTTAESASRKSGSATRAPNAGTREGEDLPVVRAAPLACGWTAGVHELDGLIVHK